VVVAEYKVLNQYLPVGTEERHEKPWSTQYHFNSKRAPFSISPKHCRLSQLSPLCCAEYEHYSTDARQDDHTTNFKFLVCFRRCSLNLVVSLIFLQNFSCYNPRISSVLRSLLTLVSVAPVPSDKITWI
jgi:hypothetical protein